MMRILKILVNLFPVFLFASQLYAIEPIFSGIVESNATGLNGDYNGTTWSAEEFANLRMRVNIGEKAKVYAAVNASATSAEEQEFDTYAELERLYSSVGNDYFGLDAGYMRIAFGYGQAFKPSDFLNPPNPVYPEARPKGTLGSTLSFYPADGIKLQMFAADRKNPYSMYPGFSRPLGGLMGEVHASFLSIQALYAAQKPEERGSKQAVSYGGLSLKFDAIFGIALDSMYTYNGGGHLSVKDLQAALGIDYSFFNGDLYFLVQYFFNGDGYLNPNDDLNDLYGYDTWDEIKLDQRIPLSGFSDFYRKHYAFLSAMYSVSDYTRISVSILSATEDLSFLPALNVEHEPFQGMTVSLTARVPVDRHVLNGGEYGELGPEFTGITMYFLGSVKYKF
jgi:hypothetical protein